MDNSPSPASAQEKLSGALASIVFFLPLLTHVKTEYVVGYMKQGFMINVIQFTCSIISMFLWFLSPILGLVNFGFFILSLFLAYQAYSGKSYSIGFLSENASKLIQSLSLGDLFSPTK